MRIPAVNRQFMGLDFVRDENGVVGMYTDCGVDGDAVHQGGRDCPAEFGPVLAAPVVALADVSDQLVLVPDHSMLRFNLI